ncbi:hypothetical protein A3B50_00580 [Candidatus Roizmanbacteria bacterium RIFCSPLOWO2_01_FULL_40_42]|uniref:Uncharacterized protein n=1 Tax=Candidatus Roizmanbacteria bacterium RIFCSPLOWO2_01_FULL_40_42 TaxID=1802066 RepID=A0A1F7J4Z4_9BACT|nr:MAG: hypothetical protein A2779_01485 [Candidatus Roizmanbacteria bacterium RIFCSPHIGHO2_01_FULL_40_98]OGK29032.1 MAG: hypothetical protein A3C31_02125 [Candidatus Roizmanbacteria bacterium RIFCSPHIGHO2_02_FULL_40_53]OGK36287.1 MAG: hypothetical protein A3E69_03570 [Candidatus Roizmanbacteria bacterium RIFCSPHIGHO2_12_FULL_40_130]OGK50659.1 MAG: hypothetical protein A3B50_00580 [Candidatus Roizmanbacteria bacterium RIFCSPLOWO2_01_FULL_40_42]
MKLPNVQGGKKTYLVLVVLCYLFYWFQLRPASIRIECDSKAKDKANKVLYERAELLEKYQRGDLLKVADKGLHYPDDYDRYYESCLHEKGLK